MSKLQYYAQRLGITALLLFFVATFLFLIFRLMPGSYATVLAGQGASPEQIQRITELWGLNDPLHEQYIRYLRNLSNGELGTSRVSRLPVWETIRRSLLNSFVLALPAILLAFALGSVYGAVLGSNFGSRLEKYGILPPTFFGTMPDFLIGIIMIVIFASHLDIFPSAGMVSVETYDASLSIWQVYTTWDFWFHYVLPFATIVLRFFYFPAMIMRSSVIEVQDQDFFGFKKTLGLRQSTRLRHLMKHASLPVITIMPVVTSRALSGLLLIEIVFNWPGIGKLLFDAVLARDTPVIQFAFLLIAAWIVIGNFVVDVVYTLIDPRITIEGE